MIVNESAITGIKQILSTFSDSDVLSLCATVTYGLLKKKVQSREAAIDAIIHYSSDPSSFLRRKLLTRNHLFEYLFETGIKVKLPITKDELIDTIVKEWDKNCPSIKNSSDTTQTSQRTEENNLSEEEEYYQVQQAEISSTNSPIVSNNIISSVSTSVSTNNDLISSNDLEAMSLQFCEWFYTLLNKPEVIPTEHFYPDTSLQIKLISKDLTQIEEALNNADEVSNLLFKVKSEHGLFFNPNCNREGTRGKMDPHGLVMIMCCGTLHINEVISGVFEQIFALARDPTSANNWKIKNSRLVLRSKIGVTHMPTLEENGVLMLES